MKFSITIPAYKREYLKECIESVLAQTYTDFEIVIVDDNSPENLKDIVNEFDDERIRYFRNERNCGAVNVVDNWNKCLEYSKGDYIICMGDDDKLLPNCLADYVDLMKKHPGLSVYHGWTERIDEKSQFLKITANRSEYEDMYSLIWHRWSCRNEQYIGDFLFDVATLRRNGGFYKLPLAWASDDITAVIAAKEKGIANTQTLVFQYRTNPYTISSTGNVAIKLQAVLLEKQWYEELLKEEPSIDKNSIEWKYYLACCCGMQEYFQKKIARTIANDLQHGFICKKFWHYTIHRNRYGISAMYLIYAVCLATKNVMSNKRK